MSEKELWFDWLLSSYSYLGKIKKEIHDLENEIDCISRKADFQVLKMKEWLDSGELDYDSYEDLTDTIETIERIPDDKNRKLAYLKQKKKLTLYKIKKIEKELNTSD